MKITIIIFISKMKNNINFHENKKKYNTNNLIWINNLNDLNLNNNLNQNLGNEVQENNKNNRNNMKINKDVMEINKQDINNKNMQNLDVRNKYINKINLNLE